MNAFTDVSLPTVIDYTPACPAAIPSLAAALERVGTWADLQEARRRDLRSDLKAAAAIIGLPAGDIFLECQTLSKALMGKPARAYGLNVRRHRNIVSSIRYVLRRLEISPPKSDGPKAFSPEWRRVWDQIPVDATKARLSRAFAFYSRNGISPSAVDEAQQAVFVATLLHSELIHDPQALGRRVTKAWNDLAASLPMESLKILERKRQREPYVKPLAAFAETFQRDIETYRSIRSSDDASALFEDLLVVNTSSPSRPPKPLRQSTIDLRVDQLLLAAAALVNTGRRPETIMTLRDLVEPAPTVKTILTYFWERGGQKKGSFIAGIAEALRQVAKFHCRLEPAKVAVIDAMKKRVMADCQTGICPRNRDRLRAMIEPHNRALLLHLPDELVRQAHIATKRDIKLRLLTSAIALEILFVCPLRISNLLGLRLDRHLRRAVGPKRLITHIILEPSEVKNNVAIEWPVPKGTADRLEVWLKARQALCDESGGGWLFPGENGQHRCISSMRSILSDDIERIVGIKVNPHLLRHFAAWLFLKHNPGQYEPVRRILSHRNITTTMMAYTGLEADTAARRLDDVVMRERQVTRMIANGVFAKRARKKRVQKKDAAAQPTRTEAKRTGKKPAGPGGR